MNDKSDKFTENIRSLLNQSLDDLDTDTEFKLGRLKHRALDSAKQKKKGKIVWGVIPATAVLLLVVLFNIPQNQQMNVASPDVFELNILTAEESLDFYAEDIEFYEWLSEVMEDELELSGQHTVVPVNSVSNRPLSAGNRQQVITQFGADRVSWSIRG
ncbi:MAG: hypothetical protein U9Q61_03980 [Thermodesulfobacteriota bacterium]|nr:hypothetical protein [Thermodesulfobacteriota bacterium]